MQELAIFSDPSSPNERMNTIANVQQALSLPST